MADPTAATAEVVRARRFELVDREGRLRGVFGELPNPDDTIPPTFGVCLFDAKGRQRTFLCLDYMGSWRRRPPPSCGGTTSSLTAPDRDDAPTRRVLAWVPTLAWAGKCQVTNL